MTGKLWSYLRFFASLVQLTILDGSLSFPPSLPQLPSVTSLKAERVTSHSYGSLLYSMPNLNSIDVTIDNEVRNMTLITGPQIMTTMPVGPASGQLVAVHVSLRSSPPPSTGQGTESGKTIADLSLLFSKKIKGEQATLSLHFNSKIIRGEQLLQVSGLKERDEEALVDLFVKTICWQSFSLSGNWLEVRDEALVDPFIKTTHLQSFKTIYGQSFGYGRGSTALSHGMRVMLNSRLEIKNCKLSTEMTHKLWSCLSSSTSVAQLTILDGSLSFPPHSSPFLSDPNKIPWDALPCTSDDEPTKLCRSRSFPPSPPDPPQLRDVTRLKAERVTSLRYEWLFSLIPSLKGIEITVDNAERDMSDIIAGLESNRVHRITSISLQAQSSLPSESKKVSKNTMTSLGRVIRKRAENLESLELKRITCTAEEDLTDVVDCCRHVKTMTRLSLKWCGTGAHGKLDSYLKQIRSMFFGNFRVDVYHNGSDHCNSTFISHTA